MTKVVTWEVGGYPVFAHDKARTQPSTKEVDPAWWDSSYVSVRLKHVKWWKAFKTVCYSVVFVQMSAAGRNISNVGTYVFSGCRRCVSLLLLVNKTTVSAVAFIFGGVLPSF